MNMRRHWLPLTVVSVIALVSAGPAFAASPQRPSAHPAHRCPAASASRRHVRRCGPIACPLSGAGRSIRPVCACPVGPIPAAARFGICPGSVSVAGAVTTPATYSDAQLAAMPQTTFTVTAQGRGGPVSATGVSLENLVAAARPSVDPTIKNGLLRVTVSVAGRLGAPVTFGEGELDPSFGNHPAYLALTVGGQKLHAPALLVPGDDQPIRDVPAVSTITVGVQSPTPTPGFTPGTLTVEQGSRATTLTAAQLAALPPETLQASFLAGTTTTNVTELGPSLDEVLRAARVPLGVGTWVAGVGDDGYVAVVTPAEQWVGGKHLQISLNENGAPLAEPRPVVDGDVKGGRYVSGLVDLVVGQGARPRRFTPTPRHHPGARPGRPARR
jgi:hypothetical protein